MVRYAPAVTEKHRQWARIIHQRMDDLGVSLRDVVQVTGISRASLNVWINQGIRSEDTYTQLCDALGIQKDGSVQLTDKCAPIMEICAERLRKQTIAEEKRNPSTEVRAAAERISLLNGQRSSWANIKHPRSLYNAVQRMRCKGLEDMLTRFGDEQPFEADKLQEIDTFRKACRVLRQGCWHVLPEAITEMMPDKKVILSGRSITMFEAKQGGYSQKIPAPRSICNLLAGLYLYDQHQPEEAQRLQHSQALRDIASFMQSNKVAPRIYNEETKVLADRAIHDVIDAAIAIEPELREKTLEQMHLLYRRGIHRPSTDRSR